MAQGSLLKRWAADRLGGKRQPPPAPAPAAPPPPPPPEVAWPISRIAAVESLWGEGFLMPGGAREVTRLAKPLGLRAETSLLLVGAGTGGPVRTLVGSTGCRCTTLEQDPRLAELGAMRLQRAEKLSPRISALPWDAAVPQVPTHEFDVCLALSPLRGDRPTNLLQALEHGLRTGGQMVLQDLIAGAALEPRDPDVATWSRHEQREPVLPDEVIIGKALAALDFDVRAAEDETERHVAMALAAWRQAAKAMAAVRPQRGFLPALVNEAERWQARLRLLQSGRIRVMRWHMFKG